MDTHELQGQEKLEEVARLMGLLRKNLSEKSLSSTKSVEILLKLRQHGTQLDHADPIYSKTGIETLASYGVGKKSPEVRRAALRCIANALLLDPTMRQVFVDTGYGEKVAERLKNDSSEDEMIISRILFLCTYDTTMNFDGLIKKNNLGENINYHITRHAKQFSKGCKKTFSQDDELALTDTLKLMFNLSNFSPDLAPIFSPSIPHMLKMISRMDIRHQPLDGVIGYLINSLSILDLDGKKARHFEGGVLFPKFNQNCNVDKLINILDQAVSMYKPEELETRAIPLLHLLITICELAPEGPRKYMQWLLLPEDSDRSQPIGHDDTLSSKLLRLSTTPSPHLKTAISELMFVLSGKCPENLTKNIGYGFAAGFLASRGLEIPQNAGEAFSTNNFDPEINPITGQRWDAEPEENKLPMTPEQKEREAEKLFILFERAGATGIINVENPVVQALREGRLEELPDDDDSD
ncbi:Guanine nucleotide exchange factor [Elaphomyces granulatus]